MSTDALAQARAILTTALELIRDDDEVAREVALIPRVRDFVLPPDHPLRTGKESEPMFDAARETFNRAIVNWHWDEAMRQAVRAALAVLRESLDK